MHNPKKQKPGEEAILRPRRLDPKDEQYYDNADLKIMLNVSDSTLYRMRRDKELPFQKLRGKICYPKSYFNTIFLKQCLARLSKPAHD